MKGSHTGRFLEKCSLTQIALGSELSYSSELCYGWMCVLELSPKDEAKSPSKEKGGGAGGGGLQPLQLVSTDFRDMSEKGTSGFVGYVPGM